MYIKSCLTRSAEQRQVVHRRVGGGLRQSRPWRRDNGLSRRQHSRVPAADAVTADRKRRALVRRSLVTWAPAAGMPPQVLGYGPHVGPSAAFEVNIIHLRLACPSRKARNSLLYDSPARSCQLPSWRAGLSRLARWLQRQYMEGTPDLPPETLQRQAAVFR